MRRIKRSIKVTNTNSVPVRDGKEGNVLFNDALNTFYLRKYDVRHMVNDHSDSERGNLLPPHRLLFPVSSKVFYMHHPTDRITHTTEFVTPVVEHWLEREIAQWVHPMKDRSDDPSHHERTPLPRSYISLLNFVLTMVAVFGCEKSLKLRRKKKNYKSK